MITELERTAAVFPSDERTREWLAVQRRQGDYSPLAADTGATYDEDEVIDLSELEPPDHKAHLSRQRRAGS